MAVSEKKNLKLCGGVVEKMHVQTRMNALSIRADETETFTDISVRVLGDVRQNDQGETMGEIKIRRRRNYCDGRSEPACKSTCGMKTKDRQKPTMVHGQKIICVEN